MALVFVLFSLLINVYQTIPQDSLKIALLTLDDAIENQDKYNDEKEKRIQVLKSQLGNVKLEEEFFVNHKLFCEYQFYQFDSAYHYATKLESLATRINIPEYKAIASKSLLSCFKSVGYFKEAIDIIDDFEPEGVSDMLLAEFYMLCAGTYQNLSSFVNAIPDFSQKYDEKVLDYYSLALSKAEKNSFLYNWILLEVQLIQNYTDSLAINSRKELIDKFKLDEHDLAVQYSILANSYRALQMRDNELYYRALSSVNDIKSSCHETTSAKAMAEEMYSAGDINRAYTYIHKALEDARFYNSQLRLMEINAILPQIGNARFLNVNRQRILYLLLSVLVFVLLSLSITLNSKLRHQSKRLKDVNKTLGDVNEDLKEVNEIKDKYIMQSLQDNSLFVNDVEEKAKDAIRRITIRDYDEAKAILYNLGIKEERDRVYSSFDSAFIALFPNFIKEFNALLREDSQFDFEEPQTLPMEVRIYALMRLGISNPAQVAEYLHLTINTVYVYKSKVKSRTNFTKEDFESKVLQIPKK